MVNRPPDPTEPEQQTTPPEKITAKIAAKFLGQALCVAVYGAKGQEQVPLEEQRMVVGLSSGLVQLLDLKGNPIGDPFQGHTDSVWSVAFSPDGQSIVSGSSDNTLRRWDLDGNSIGDPFQGHSAIVWSVAYSPDGQSIVSGSADHTLRRWDLDGNSIGDPFQGHSDSVTSVVFSPDGQFIVSGSGSSLMSLDNTLRRWDLDGNPIGDPFQGHSSGVSSVAYSPDGQSIVSGSFDYTLRRWDLDGNLIGDPFKGHSFGVNSVAFSPDGQSIVSGSSDYTLRRWDLDGNLIGNPFKGHLSGVNSVAFSADGQSIVSSSSDNTLCCWDLDGNLIGDPFHGHSSGIWSVAFSPDGQSIVSGSDDNTLRRWDLGGNPIGDPFHGHTDRVTSVTFSPDGQSIVSGSDDNTLRRWDLDGNSISAPFHGHSSGIWSVAFSPDGQSIVSGSSDNTLRRWDLDGNPIGDPFYGHTDSVYSVAYSPDGQSIVSGSDDQTLRRWDLDGNPISAPFQGHSSAIWSVAYSPDGQSIVSGSDDNTLRRWDLDGNPSGNPFHGHFDRVWSVAFSFDGQSIVSGSDDQTLRRWDLDGNPIGDPFQGHSDWVTSVAFSPDGQAIVSGSSDHTLRLWPTAMEKAVSQGVVNDNATGEDNLNIEIELKAIAEVLLLRSLEPPLAVGLLGNWGSGKSFGMNLIQSQINNIRNQFLRSYQTWDTTAPDNPLLSPYVGHIYQIQFNCWTYAKSNLWASLMQEIFYELNRQISLEQQLAKVLSTPASSGHQSTNSMSANQDTPNKSNKLSRRIIDRAIYDPIKALKHFAVRFIWQPLQYLILKLLQPLDLTLFPLALHFIFFIFFLILPLLLLLELIGLTQLIKKFLIVLIQLISKSLTGRFNSIPNTIENWFANLSFSKKIEHLLAKQWRYYWVDSKQRKYSRVEIIIERLIFFLFVGFPTRWLDRYQWWQKQFQYFPWVELEKENQESAISENELNRQMSATLLAGGEVWKALYTLNEEEQNLLIQAKLGKQKFEAWKKAVFSESDISNYLWNALDHLRTDEQKRLKETKDKLQEKETQLQRQIERAEVDVHKKLSRRIWTTFWTPVLHALASLRFSEDEIKAFSAKAQNDQLFRKTIKSWQGFLALILLGIVLVFSFTPEGLPSLLDQFTAWLNQAKVRDEAKFWITVGTSTLVTLLPTLKALGDYITAVQKEQAQIKSDRETLLEDARTQDKKLIQEIDQLKLQVREQKERIGLTASHSSLMDFVTARLDEKAYGQHLGLMQQVRQDLKDLSNRLIPGSHNIEQLKKLFPRGPVRVVLYIDDLDRCPPNRVVEVLEAIQLLLKTKLFIVILAIDDRYIARALEDVYKGVLIRRGKPSGIDYLEKIIQLPYRMRPMAPDAITNYFKKQVIVAEPPQPSTTSKDKQAPTAPTLTAAPIPPDAAPSQTLNGPEQTLLELLEPGQVDPQEPRQQEPKKQEDKLEKTTNVAAFQDSLFKREAMFPNFNTSVIVAKPNDKADALIKPDVFEYDTFRILVHCCQQVDLTPRIGKRLINICKILQIIWKKSTPPTPESKVILIAFLALSSRYPDFMRDLFEEITTELEENGNFIGPSPRPVLKTKLATLLKPIAQQISPHDYYTNQELNRFLGDIARMFAILPLPAPGEQIPRPKGAKKLIVVLNQDITIPSNIFHLTLSFCFVGDIGYDSRDGSYPTGHLNSHNIETRTKHQPLTVDRKAPNTFPRSTPPNGQTN